VEGAIGPESCIVVMTHQSVLDIPIGLSLVPGPYPLIPTRDRYRIGIPGVSPLVRLARFPFVSQGQALTRKELRALITAADQVARGEQSLLIFPEGHRTRDGAIGPFMRSGLHLMLRRARRPVYCVVCDGVTQSRAVTDALTRIAGTRVQVVVLGPFPPPEAADIDTFIESLRERMIATLAAMRAGNTRDMPNGAPLPAPLHADVQ
jgi:1-acyl-sn-glycerol-3-phosphate acyltransferase